MPYIQIVKNALGYISTATKEHLKKKHKACLVLNNLFDPLYLNPASQGRLSCMCEHI